MHVALVGTGENLLRLVDVRRAGVGVEGVIAHATPTRRVHLHVLIQQMPLGHVVRTIFTLVTFVATRLMETRVILELRLGIGFVRAHLALVALRLLAELVEAGHQRRFLVHVLLLLLLDVDGAGGDLRLQLVLVFAAVDFHLQHRGKRDFLVVAVDQLRGDLAAGRAHDGHVGVDDQRRWNALRQHYRLEAAVDVG